MNMRRILKNPRLRMEDGGSVGLATATPESMAAAAAAGERNLAGFARQSAALAPASPTDAQVSAPGRRDRMLAAGNRTQAYQPMNAMPAGLQLRDGGEVSPWSLKGMANSVSGAFTKTPEQIAQAQAVAEYRARAAAERSAAAAAPTPAPRATAAPMGSQSVLDRRMAAAGLRDGGDLRTGQGGNVPGTGSGDKIPAKYEPGEFVVSNAMLDAAPGLREELHDLRGNVLAKQGKSVAQADAEAVTPKGLRASKGGVLDSDYLKRAFPNGAQDLDLGSVGKQPNPQAMGGAAQRVVPPVAPSTAPQYTPPKVDPSTGRYANGPQSSGAGVPGSSGAGSTTSAGGAGRAAASLKPTAAGRLSDKLLGTAADWKKTTDTLNKARSIPGAGAVGTVLKGVAAPISAYQTYQDIKAGNYGDATVHGVDTAAGAALFTPVAPAAAAYLGARTAYEAPQQLRNALGESGLDAIGGTLNTIANKFGLGYDEGKKQDNDIALAGMSGAPKPRTPNTPAPRPINHRGQGYDDPRRVNADPSRASLGASVDNTLRLGAVPKDLPSDLREGVIHKTVGPNGTTVYSGRNVSGDAQFVDGMGKTIAPRGNVMSSSALREGASADSGVSAALAAAAARGDMDSVRAYYANKGESFGGVSAAQYREQQEDAKAPKRGEFGFNNYMKNKQLNADRAVTLRGQDMDLEGRMAPAKAAERQRAIAASIFEQAGGDHTKAAKIAMSLGMPAKDYYDAIAAENTAEASRQTMGTKARENMLGEFAAFDAEGKPDPATAQLKTNMARQLFPGIDSTNEAVRNKGMSDAKEMLAIFEKARTQDKVGLDALKFWQQKRPTLSGMPDVRGLKDEQVGFLDGMITPGANGGDVLIKRKDGSSLNLGQLNSRQRELLETAQKTGWGK